MQRPAEPAPAELPPGDPLALGAHLLPGAVSFALWAPEASAVELCLFDDLGQRETARWSLGHCRDGVWHGRLQGASAGLVYGYRVHGPWDPARGLRFNPQRLLLDPWAHDVVGQYSGDLSAYLGHDPQRPDQPHPVCNARQALKARVVPTLPAPTVQRAAVAPARRVIAEVHVRTASACHPGVPEELRGTYAGLAHPALIAHWRELGITTLELLPLQQRADEARLQALGLPNHWGYSTIAYFAAEPRYWSGRAGSTPASELRAAIADLRAAGFEVWLDVVYNHSAETDEFGPTLSFRGIANRHWYRLDPDDPARYLNWAGCGNTLNLAQPMVLRLVIDSLRHWVQSYGIDGFRFDLATALARDDQGRFSGSAAFFGALQADPVLRRVAWIAEPWDLGPDGYQAGRFPPGWLEWNDRSRDTLRACWLRPDNPRASRADLAQRVSGSSDRFGHDPRHPRSALASVNYVTAHDGFTLRDLVSYDQRHNQANGEDNRDGHHDNLSWNAGVEGPSADPGVLGLRAQLQRGLLATLLLSRGTPMLLAGDEIGHSQNGNNNAYNQDSPTTWLAWDQADHALAAFVTRLLALRRADPALHAEPWLSGRAGADAPADVVWARPDGEPLSVDDWHQPAGAGLQVLLTPPRSGHQTLLLFNPGAQAMDFCLPAPYHGQPWVLRLDSHRALGDADEAAARSAADPARSGATGFTRTLPARCVHVWISGSGPPAAD